MSRIAITIIDDDASARGMLGSLLRLQGHHRIESLDDRNERLYALDDIRPGVVFLDIRMPTHDGFKLLERLRQNCPDCFVVMVSAHASLDNVRRAMELGADGFIAKPYSSGRVKDVLEKYVRSRAGGDRQSA